MWDVLDSWIDYIGAFPGVTLEDLTKAKLLKLKSWYIERNYSNATIANQFKYLKSFLIWLQTEGYELQPGVFNYKPNLTIVPKTVTFLKYKELMDFYNYKFADDEKNLELARDMFCFMAFTSLRYSDLENLKKANVFALRKSSRSTKTRNTKMARCSECMPTRKSTSF